MGNKKLKSVLTNLYEGKTFEHSFNDTHENENDVYSFKYIIKVTHVLGDDDESAIVDMAVIISEIKFNGEDFMYDWAESDYSSHVWYIERLMDEILDDIFIPVSIYLTPYSVVEYNSL